MSVVGICTQLWLNGVDRRLTSEMTVDALSYRRKVSQRSQVFPLAKVLRQQARGFSSIDSVIIEMQRYGTRTMSFEVNC